MWNESLCVNSANLAYIPAIMSEI